MDLSKIVDTLVSLTSLKSKEDQRILFRVRERLKTLFDGVLEAFVFVDQHGIGSVSLSDLREVCSLNNMNPGSLKF